MKKWFSYLAISFTVLINTAVYLIYSGMVNEKIELIKNNCENTSLKVSIVSSFFYGVIVLAGLVLVTLMMTISIIFLLKRK